MTERSRPSAVSPSGGSGRIQKESRRWSLDLSKKNRGQDLVMFFPEEFGITSRRRDLSFCCTPSPFSRRRGSVSKMTVWPTARHHRGRDP